MEPGTAFAIVLSNPANGWANGMLVTAADGSATYKGVPVTLTSSGWSVTLPHGSASCEIDFSVQAQFRGVATSGCFPGGRDTWSGSQASTAESKTAGKY